MTKPTTPKSAVAFTGTVVTVSKEPCGFLAVAHELTIVDGVVVTKIALNAADLPASAIGQGSRSLWRMFQGPQV